MESLRELYRIGKGPSSSHTMGPDKAARLFKEKYGIPKDGAVIKTSDKKVTMQEVLNALPKFRGEILQMPPIYSAIKVKGKKLYEYARAGEDVKIEPRKVFIEKLELQNFNEEEQVAEILVKCSKGTYIRSIANDLGELIGGCAHLIKLVRTQAGRFNVVNSIVLDDFQAVDDVVSALINPLDVLNYPVIVVNNEELAKIKNGMAIANKNNTSLNEVVILVYNDIISAVGVASEDKILIKKVF